MNQNNYKNSARYCLHSTGFRWFLAQTSRCSDFQWSVFLDSYRTSRNAHGVHETGQSQASLSIATLFVTTQITWWERKSFYITKLDILFSLPYKMRARNKPRFAAVSLIWLVANSPRCGWVVTRKLPLVSGTSLETVTRGFWLSGQPLQSA